jgi:hypothetical protein
MEVATLAELAAALWACSLIVSLCRRLRVVEGNKLPIKIAHENSPKEKRASFPALSIT